MEARIRKRIYWRQRSFLRNSKCSEGRDSAHLQKLIANSACSEMPRASEHVALLHSQYEGLMDAIYDLEESLQKVCYYAFASHFNRSSSANRFILCVLF